MENKTIWNEFTGITTNKIYKLLHNGGIKYKHSIGEL